MRTLHFDCFAGASGNMILAALVAAGVDRDALLAEVRKLPVAGFELVLSNVDRSGIASLHAEVIVPDEKAHRHLHHIESIIAGSELSAAVKERSIAIFRRLAQAEARVHGTSVEKVHFHEVGALDAIVDIVGACVGFEMLGIERFTASSIHVGSGFVRMEHGKFPVPPPAVAELLSGVPIYSTEIEGELITPTGAAIISTLCESYGRLAEMQVEVTAYGAGTRNYDDFPNVLRIFIGETAGGSTSNGSSERLTLLETNIDDMSPQLLGSLMDTALQAGALDCWFTAIQMKKNRPATLVSILCRPSEEEKMLHLLYSETTTLGVRVERVERRAADREIRKVSTDFGEIAVKYARIDADNVKAQPEFEEIKAAAAAHGVPIRAVAEKVKAMLGDAG